MIYFDPDRDETRATTHPVMAAIERFLDWWVLGPKQHDADRCWSLGVVSATSTGERTGKR